MSTLVDILVFLQLIINKLVLSLLLLQCFIPSSKTAHLDSSGLPRSKDSLHLECPISFEFQLNSSRYVTERLLSQLEIGVSEIHQMEL